MNAGTWNIARLHYDFGFIEQNSNEPKKKIALCRKYVDYLYKTRTIEFIILPARKSAESLASSTIICRIGLFVYFIYSVADLLGLQCREAAE